jgi:hypothetical protein
MGTEPRHDFRYVPENVVELCPLVVSDLCLRIASRSRRSIDSSRMRRAEIRWLERLLVTQEVTGSSPVAPANFPPTASPGGPHDFRVVGNLCRCANEDSRYGHFYAKRVYEALTRA